MWIVFLSEVQLKYEPVSHSNVKCLIEALSLPRRSSYNFSPESVLNILIKVPCSDIVARKEPSRLRDKYEIAFWWAAITIGF